MTPRCLTIATSDSGGGAGIQADLKAFARGGCHGLCALVALTAQNTLGVTAIHELPPEFVTAQLNAVFDDIGVEVTRDYSAEKLGAGGSATAADALTSAQDSGRVVSAFIRATKPAPG